jgi:hypothetical protein
LVVAGGVDGEFAEEFAVVGDDADVAVGDESRTRVPAWARPTPMWMSLER